jgi:hypothetical protein
VGVILVGRNNPRERLYLENLGIHAETAEELSYLILKYPPLFLEGFVGEAFFAFVERGALQPALARELRSYRGENARSEEVLARFLARSGYASPRQQSMFLQDAKEYLALPRERAELKRGDLFFALRKYGKAVGAYERALADDKLDRASKSRLLDREGAALANLFLSERAFDCFQEAYALGRDRNTIKRMYFLAETETDETLKARFRRELPEMRDSEKARWEEQLREVTTRGATGREAKEVADIFAEQDETKRRAREEKIIAQWREEYRSMV